MTTIKRMFKDAIRPWLGIRPWKRHSLVLMVAGLVYVGIGVSYILAEPTKGRELALGLAYRVMESDSWGVVFIIAGLLSVISSRWPPLAETWGYMVLTGLSSGWGAFYGASILFGGAPLTNVSNMMVWGLIAFLWWAISGLVNPDPVLVVRRGPS